MFQVIFEYMDRIVAAVRPRKLLYIAVDGPAPRAKLNQQRSRRFKSAKERAEKMQVEQRLRQQWEESGQKAGLPPPSSDESEFDSNVITPGTKFMATLSRWLRWVRSRALPCRGLCE